MAQALADEAMVFKDGKVIERGPIVDILRAPKEAETKRLLGAAEPARPLPPACAEPGELILQLAKAPTPFEPEMLGIPPAEIAVAEAAG